jgi:23S rRNA pseudouridine955/2504/2580 synthase
MYLRLVGRAGDIPDATVMSGGVQNFAVADGDDGIRLDRWFKKHFPHITHGRLQKWVRTGQVRVDGGRVKTGSRVNEGQNIRVPPMPNANGAQRPVRAKPGIDEYLAEDLRQRIVYQDEEVLIIDKPAGLAVQGGTKTKVHLDAYLDELRLGAGERPKLVHRLDKDTSGTLVLARTTKAARWLTAAFRQRDTRKLYWAVVAGAPTPPSGVINAAMQKRRAGSGEKMEITDKSDGLSAKTVYQIIAQAGNVASWLAMEPLTGRTHQLRLHAAEVLDTPILGDGKYGATGAFMDSDGISRKLHLHARGIRFVSPAGKTIEVFAPLPEHISRTFNFLGFDGGQGMSGFLET